MIGSRLLGAYLSGNEEVWRKNLNLIYSNLIDTVISNTIRRTTKSTSRQGSKTVTLSHELVQLAVEVCFQIYSLKLPGGSVSNGGGAAVTNITQIVPLDVTQVFS